MLSDRHLLHGIHHPDATRFHLYVGKQAPVCVSVVLCQVPSTVVAPRPLQVAVKFLSHFRNFPIDRTQLRSSEAAQGAQHLD